MPRMKADDLEFNVKELDDAEFNEDFADYEGPEPPKKTRLSGRVKKMWLTYTKPETGEKPMLVVLFEAEGNTGDKEQYNGCPIWERLPLIASAKFRWQPFLDATGLTLRQIKNKMFVAADDDNIGAPIEKIDKWIPGSDDSLVDVITARERYNDEWTTKVGRFLELSDNYDPDAVGDEDEEDLDEDEELDEEEESEDEDEEEDEEEDEDDEDDEDEEDDEDKDEEKPPARGRRAASRSTASAAKDKAAPARSARTTKPAATRTAKAPAKTAASTRSTRAASSRTTAKAAAATKRGGRRSSQEIDDDPPF